MQRHLEQYLMKNKNNRRNNIMQLNFLIPLHSMKHADRKFAK